LGRGCTEAAILSCAQSGSDGSESGGSVASTPRSAIVPAAAAALQPQPSLRRGSAMIPKLTIEDAPRRKLQHSESQDSLRDGGSGAVSAPPSQRSGFSGGGRLRALSAMEGAALATGKMQAVQRPGADAGALANFHATEPGALMQVCNIPCQSGWSGDACACSMLGNGPARCRRCSGSAWTQLRGRSCKSTNRLVTEASTAAGPH